MILVETIYDDVIKDSANTAENGELTISQFNRFSRRAEISLFNWLTGDPAGIQPPAPYITQKNKDWLSPFITKFPAHVVDGFIIRPADYAAYENFYRLGSGTNSGCDEDETVSQDECNIAIELLDGQKFYQRCNTFIEGLKPSLNKPIAKMIGNTFEVLPKDLGSVTLEYIRIPKFAEIKTKEDIVFNEVVPDTATSIDYEWDQTVRDILIYIITDYYANNTRENAIKEFNVITGKQLKT